MNLTCIFFFTIYDFLLDNTFTIQFYFFVKKNNIFLKYKKEAFSTMIIYLDNCKFSRNLNLAIFLENFVLIWDLFNYAENDLFEIKLKIFKLIDL